MGKRRDAKLAAMMESASMATLQKAGLAGTPMQQTSATLIPANQLALQSQEMPSLARALQRDVDTFGSQMGPNYPLVPSPLDPLNRNGRPDPRRYQYDISENLQITRQLAKWNVLKAAAEQCDVVARAITIRAAEVAKMDKSWIVSDEAISAIKDRDNVGTAEAASIAREENKALIADLNSFWENPYPQSDRGWREWITEALWQVMVYDGLAIHPQVNLGRKVLGFNIIDASTIKCLLDNYGGIPRPPDPAFQQILWGFPRGEFTATPDKDPSNPTPKFFDGSSGTDERDQLSYFVMNRRTYSPYGFSPTEQAIPLVNLYLEYQKMMLFEFKHGTRADVYMRTTGTELTLKTLPAYERIYNDELEGDTASRKKTRLLPEGFDPVFAPTLEEKFKPEYIESILKRIAGIYGVSSQQFGVVPRAGLGGGKGAQEGDQDNSETVSSKPMMNFIEEFVNSLSRRYLGANKNVTFVLSDDKGGKDDVSIAQAAQIDINSAAMVLNEVRKDRGMDDYDFEGADEPFVLAGNAIVYPRFEYARQLALVNAPVTQGDTNGLDLRSDTAPQGEEVTKTPPQGDVDQVSQGPGGGSKVGVDQGGAQEAALKAKEKAAFSRFIKSGKSREFEFKHHTPDEVTILKAGISTERPKSRQFDYSQA